MRYALLLLVVALTVLAGSPRAHAAETEVRTMEHGGLERLYRIRVPDRDAPGTKTPLVLAFHGGEGNAEQAERGLMFNAAAEREGFIIVYPQGAPNPTRGFHWNDGRESPRFPDATKIDDVGFIRALIEKLMKDFSIDPARIYATGNSNGGFMTQRLGWELSDVLAGIGPSAGTLGVEFEERFAPKHPIHVIQLHGTKDTLVPYNGGEVIGRGGVCIPAPRMAEIWAKANGCVTPPVVEELPDRVPDDGVTVRRSRYAPGASGGEVVFYMLEGHGHKWAGRMTPDSISGKSTTEISAAEVVWEFFKSHPKAGM